MKTILFQLAVLIIHNLKVAHMAQFYNKKKCKLHMKSISSSVMLDTQLTAVQADELIVGYLQFLLKIVTSNYTPHRRTNKMI